VTVEQHAMASKPAAVAAGQGGKWGGVMAEVVESFAASTKGQSPHVPGHDASGFRHG
jgi:hypothetical protein